MRDDVSARTQRLPHHAKDDIERLRCRRCGAEKASCFNPYLGATVVAVAFDGQDYRTDFCFERVHDYFEKQREGMGR